MHFLSSSVNGIFLLKIFLILFTGSPAVTLLLDGDPGRCQVDEETFVKIREKKLNRHWTLEAL